MAGLRSIFQQSSYREFLRAYVDYRKENGSYSLVQLSREAGFPSKNYANLIVSGKRGLSERDAIRIASALKFSEEEKRYFLTLVLHDDAKNEDIRLFYRRWLRAMKREQGASRLSSLKPVDAPRLLSEWFLPALLACLEHEFSRSASDLRAFTGLALHDVQRGLESLKAAELVREQTDGFRLITTGTMTEARFGAHFQFRDFQRAAIEKSLSALQKNAGGNFAANSMLLTEAGLGELRAKIRALLQSVPLAAPGDQAASLVQLNIQLFDFRS